MLIDTGNGGAAAERDGERILAAARDAGLTQIDHLITTHWHGDHFGAMETRRIEDPDQALHRSRRHRRGARGPAMRSSARAIPTLYAKATHTVAKPGDKIAIAGLDWRIVAAAGQHITTPLPGAGNAEPGRAPTTSAGMPDPTENAQSVGSIVTFGKFRVAHLGDLTWNKEFELDVPEQSDRHGRSVHRVAPRAGDFELAAARARAASARR